MDVLSYGREHDSRLICAAVRGEVDLATADDLLLRLRMLAGPATAEIILNLSQVTFIDCSGLRALVALEHLVRASGGRVRVTALSAAAARLFELVRPHWGSDSILDPSAPDALRPAGASDHAVAVRTMAAA